ncbi:MAG: hypothetical protein CL674_05450 [Bdellovibrionaceae bacterium]|nr:hypothetical protein [Pseudobdellovibrionaceae bacterium]|tara:strand:+ start:58986 stop:59570 length:585 start_codon:yes stop_codon:yes gene_type:complete
MTSRNLLTKKVLITSLSIFSFATVANALELDTKLRTNHQSRFSQETNDINSGSSSLDFVRISSTDKEIEICMTASPLQSKRSIIKIKKLKNPNIDIKKISELASVSGDVLTKMESDLTWRATKISLGELIHESVSAQRQNEECSVYGIFENKNTTDLDENAEVIKVFNNCDEYDPNKVSESAYKYPAYVDAVCD